MGVLKNSTIRVKYKLVNKYLLMFITGVFKTTQPPTDKIHGVKVAMDKIPTF